MGLRLTLVSCSIIFLGPQHARFSPKLYYWIFIVGISALAGWSSRQILSLAPWKRFKVRRHPRIDNADSRVQL